MDPGFKSFCRKMYWGKILQNWKQEGSSLEVKKNIAERKTAIAGYFYKVTPVLTS